MSSLSITYQYQIFPNCVILCNPNGRQIHHSSSLNSKNSSGRALLGPTWEAARFANHLIKPIRSSNSLSWILFFTSFGGSTRTKGNFWRQRDNEKHLQTPCWVLCLSRCFAQAVSKSLLFSLFSLWVQLPFFLYRAGQIELGDYSTWSQASCLEDSAWSQLRWQMVLPRAKALAFRQQGNSDALVMKRYEKWRCAFVKGHENQFLSKLECLVMKGKLNVYKKKKRKR